MLVYSLIALTLLIAVYSIFLLYRVGRYGAALGFLFTLLPIMIAVFLYLYGAWVFVSVYLRYVYVVVFVYHLRHCFVKRRENKNPPASLFLQKPRLMQPIMIGYMLATTAFWMPIVYYFKNFHEKYTTTVDLKFPFKKGKYYTLQAGYGLPANVFHSKRSTMRYAMDIVKLNAFGNRANGIASEYVTNYAIYGDTIYSPCSGRVIKVENNNPDNKPPKAERGPTNLNQVLIETDKHYVFLGHIQYQAVFVKENDSVVTGQPLGLVGNSGLSIEPHLHIQAQLKQKDRLQWYLCPPAYITFSGKRYLLFNTIDAEDLQ